MTDRSDEFTAVFRYKGKDRPRDVALKRLLKILLRSFGFECREIIGGDWRNRAGSTPHIAREEPGEPSAAMQPSDDGSRQRANGAA